MLREVAYLVQMRDAADRDRGTWATYVGTAREAAFLSKAELARRLNVDRGTVHRWEAGQTRPENAAVVLRAAEVLGLDREEALAAAGFRPDVEAPAEPTLTLDEEIELVRTDPKLDLDMKRRIIEMILDRRQQEREAGLASTRRIIEALKIQRRSGS